MRKTMASNQGQWEQIMEHDDALSIRLASLKAGIGAAVAVVALCFVAAFLLSAPVERMVTTEKLEMASGEADARALSGRQMGREMQFPH